MYMYMYNVQRTCTCTPGDSYFQEKEYTDTGVCMGMRLMSGGTRTRDLLHTVLVPYQLSHRGSSAGRPNHLNCRQGISPLYKFMYMYIYMYMYLWSEVLFALIYGDICLKS